MFLIKTLAKHHIVKWKYRYISISISIKKFDLQLNVNVEWSTVLQPSESLFTFFCQTNSYDTSSISTCITEPLNLMTY